MAITVEQLIDLLKRYDPTSKVMVLGAVEEDGSLHFTEEIILDHALDLEPEGLDEEDRLIEDEGEVVYLGPGDGLWGDKFKKMIQGA